MQGNLLRHISRIGSLSEAHIVQNVMQPVLQALQYLHEQASPLAPGSPLHCHPDSLHKQPEADKLLLAKGGEHVEDIPSA